MVTLHNADRSHLTSQRERRLQLPEEEKALPLVPFRLQRQHHPSLGLQLAGLLSVSQT